MRRKKTKFIARPPKVRADNYPYSEARHAAVYRLLQAHSVITEEELKLRSVVDRAVHSVLTTCEGSRSLAADILGISRRTLQRMIPGVKKRLKVKIAVSSHTPVGFKRRQPRAGSGQGPRVRRQHASAG